MNSSDYIPVKELAENPRPAEAILQNEGLKTKPVQYAGFWKRASAYIYDAVILWVINFLVAFIIAFVIMGLGIGSSKEQLVAAITIIVVDWLYFALQESSPKQATLGKRIFEIKVTGMDNSRITFVRASVRYISKILSDLIFGFGYVMAGTTQKKQALHDMIADTLVVNK